MDSGWLISAIRVLCLVAAASALAGCGAHSSYAPQIAKSRAEYEQAVLSGHPAVRRTAYASRTIPRSRAVAAVTTSQSVAARPRATASRIADPNIARASTTYGSGAADNPYPVGSPEWHAEWKRMDENLKLKLNSICARC
jgi:hypothetical protein